MQQGNPQGNQGMGGYNNQNPQQQQQPPQGYYGGPGGYQPPMRPGMGMPAYQMGNVPQVPAGNQMNPGMAHGPTNMMQQAIFEGFSQQGFNTNPAQSRLPPQQQSAMPPGSGYQPNPAPPPQQSSMPPQPSYMSTGLGQGLPPGLPSSSQSQPAHPPVSHQQSGHKRLNPPAYPPDVLRDLPRHSTGALCIIGKELLHDLNLRMVLYSNTMRIATDRKTPQSSQQDPEILINYCLHIFDKLNEIRILIDTRMNCKPIEPAEFLKSWMDPTEPKDNRPKELKKRYDDFNKNTNRLLTLTHDLKLLDWMATISDPSLLKKVDKMSAGGKEFNTNF